jgi:hypothetical protein
LTAQRLSVDWLALDRAGVALKDAAKNITPKGRLDLSNELSRAVESQGVATVTLKEGQDRNDVFVSMLAQGSTRPDVIQFRLDDPESIRRALAELNVSPPLHRPSIGVVAIDAQDAGGVVVAAVAPDGPAARAGLMPGTIIVNAGGTPVGNVAALLEALQNADKERKSTPVSLDVKDPAGAARKVDVPVVWSGRAISQTDQTLLFNPILLNLRHQLASGANASNEPVLRLNIAIALMSLGNWADAKAELEKVQLPDGKGVGQGTVNYLLGLCNEALGQFGDAMKAWTAARNSEANVTEDGPPVKELAAAKLAKLNGSRPGGN